MSDIPSVMHTWACDMCDLGCDRWLLAHTRLILLPFIGSMSATVGALGANANAVAIAMAL